MLAVWADYAGGRPGGAALARAGIAGVIRYAGIGSSGKRLTAAEYADLKANGIQVMLVVESTTTEDDNGYQAGVNDARAAEADRIAFGLPADTVIFAVNDKTTYTAADLDYVRGFRDVLGRARTGAYGFGSFVAAVRAAATGSVFWQAGPAPSRVGTTGIAQLWQRNGGPVAVSDGPTTPVTASIAGVTCDLNNQLLPLPAAPAPTPPAPAGSETMGATAGTFEHGVTRHTIPFTVGTSSVTQSQAWLRVRTAWGAISGLQVVFEDDRGDDLGTVNVATLANNTSDPFQLPDGCTGVNVGWSGETPNPGVDHPSVGWSIEYKTK